MRSSSHPGVVAEGQRVTFPLLSEDSATITYTVTASNEERAHSFSGTVRNDQGEVVAVGGALAITVRAEEPPPSGHSATRSFSPGTVVPGGEVVVTIKVAGVGGFGGVAETLPVGFTYVSSSHPGVVAEGQRVTFPLLGEDSVTITYTVTASNEERAHSFSGTVRNDQGEVVAVGGALAITVRAEEPPPSGHSATRSFSPGTVVPGGEVVVTIKVVGVGGFGGVAETLPVGFTYVSSSHPGVVAEGQRVTFPLLSEDSATITYTVTASNEERAHSFSGTVRNDQGEVVAVRGASSVRVGTRTPPPTDTTPPTTGGSSSGSGSGGGSTSVTATPTPTPTPAATATPPPTVVPTTPPPPATLVPTAVPDTPMPTAPVAIPVGPPGEEGEQGEPGTIGNPGSKGKPGAIGGPGPKGATGSAGPKGAIGSAGPKGATGSAGETGARGGAGPVGEAGATGESGSGILGIVALILGIVAIVGVGGAFLLRRN